MDKIAIDSEPVNQRTIAEHLEVSVATVSKALRGHTDISPEMRQRVGEAAEALGYLPKSGAGQTGRARASHFEGTLLGLLIRRPIDSGLQDRPTYLSAFTQCASRMNVSVVTQEMSGNEDPLSLLDRRNLPPVIRDGRVSGIALGGMWPAKLVREINKRHRVVLFPQYQEETGADSVGFDKLAIMLQLCSRLKKLGHRRIGFFGRCGEMPLVSKVFAGYIHALDRLGLPIEMDWVVDVDRDQMLSIGHDDYWQGKVNQAEGMKKRNRVDAWVCCNDWPAYQLYRGLTDRGYRVPEDVSITGFDDNEPTNLGCPHVTSIRVPVAAICKATIRLLLDRIDNPISTPVHMNLDCEIIDHGTIGPPSAA